MLLYIQLDSETHTHTNVLFFFVRVLQQIFVEITCEFSNCFRCLHFSFILFLFSFSLLLCVFYFFRIDLWMTAAAAGVGFSSSFFMLFVFHSIYTHIHIYISIHLLSHARSRTLWWCQIFIYHMVFFNAIYSTNFTFRFFYYLFQFLCCLGIIILFFVLLLLFTVGFFFCLFVCEDLGFFFFLLKLQLWLSSTYWLCLNHSTHCSSIYVTRCWRFWRLLIFLLRKFQTIHKNYNTCTWNNSNRLWNKYEKTKSISYKIPNVFYGVAVYCSLVVSIFNVSKNINKPLDKKKNNKQKNYFGMSWVYK